MGKIHGNDPTGYSYGDADALKSAATGLANAISGQSGSRASYVTTASREFRGYFSQVFADNADVASRGASELVGALQSLSGFVEQLREAAKHEDDRRAKAKAWAARKKEREDNVLVAAAHEVGTWFGADDDPKPPEPEPEPHRQADAVTVSGRTIPAGGGGGGGGTSSAVPADLRSFQSGIRSCDESLAGAVSTFRNALTDYESGCNPCWGTLNAQSLVTAVNDWLTANGQDAAWAGTVAAHFEAAGGGTGPATLSDASISAALAAAGIDATRDDLTIGPFSAMGRAAGHTGQPAAERCRGRRDVGGDRRHDVEGPPADFRGEARRRDAAGTGSLLPAHRSEWEHRSLRWPIQVVGSIRNPPIRTRPRTPRCALRSRSD